MSTSTAAKRGRRIAIVGASGNVGRPILTSLLAEGIHTITVISRPESSATFPDGVARVERGDYTDDEFLGSALAGQDVLVLLLSVSSMSAQPALIKAAARAGVRTVLPTEFGSDPAPTPLLERLPMLGAKKGPRDLIEALGMGRVAVATNPWLEYNLEHGTWGFDVAKRTARLIDGGRVKFVTTTLPTVGRATAGLLSLPDAELDRFRNGPAVYLRSFRISQRDMFESLLRATGTAEADWAVEDLEGEEAVAKAKEVGGMAGMMREFFALHMREGFGGDYEAKVGGTMELLGAVETETLDEAVGRVVKKMQA